MTANSSSKNSLDLLRLLSALLVLYSHQFELLGLGQPSFFGWNTFGGLGVSIFFFLSGCLVSESWRRDPNLYRFFARRALRIFPALWMVVLLSVLALGPITTSLTLPQYFSAASTWAYLSGMFLAIRYFLPGVFMGNPYPGAVNGSLWTLPVEFLCYLGVGLLGTIRGVAQPILAVAMVWAVMFSNDVWPSTFIGKYSTHMEMLATFWWGAVYGYFRTGTNRHQAKPWIAIATGVTFLLYLLMGSRGFERTAMLVTVALLVQSAMSTPYGAKFTDWFGDLSYGVYIFAFPVQQTIVSVGVKYNWEFPMQLGLSLGITIVLAYLSWHLVEKRALHFKPARHTIP